MAYVVANPAKVNSPKPIFILNRISLSIHCSRVDAKRWPIYSYNIKFNTGGKQIDRIGFSIMRKLSCCSAMRCGVQAQGHHMTPDVQLVWKADCLLGEGPAWFGDEQLLRFVDIKRGNLHVFNPATGAQETHFLGGSPSFILPETGGSLLVGSRQSIWRLDGNSFGKEVARIPEPAHNRINDATVDAEGRIWLGTMDDQEQQRSGAIWCSGKAEWHRAGAEAVVTNGPAISPDGRWIYCVDSGERTIWRFPLQPHPKLEAGEIFITIEKGFPDGVVLDSMGNLWVALWDGSAVRQYDPSGNLVLEVPIACTRVTKIALGGPDLCTAFVTTARIGLNADDLAEQPLAGALFSFRVETPGQILPPVNLYL